MVLVHCPWTEEPGADEAPHRSPPITSLPAAYYDFVRTAATPVIIPEGTGVPAGPPALQPGRAAPAGLLEDFCYGESDATLGEPNWSLVIEEARSPLRRTRILDAIRWRSKSLRLAQDRVVFIEGRKARTCGVDALVAETNRAGVIQLPWRAKAVARVPGSRTSAVRSLLTTVMRLGHEARIRTVGARRPGTSRSLWTSSRSCRRSSWGS